MTISAKQKPKVHSASKIERITGVPEQRRTLLGVSGIDPRSPAAAGENGSGENTRNTQLIKELAFQNEERENRAAELIVANKELAFQNEEKENRAAELIVANEELAFQNEEKENRAAELILANVELAFQNEEKENRAAELTVANKELAFQNEEKENRAAELIVANTELAFQNEEKENRAAELIVANKELAFQNEEKENRAAELIVANKELAFQNEEKEDRAAELIVANKELAYQNEEKENRAAELVVANKELAFQNEEKENRAAELILANKELAFQNEEKENRAAELILANKELAFQNEEKENRAAELILANKELAFQNEEKENRAAELILANKELAFQNEEKENRAAELILANKELAFQNEEKERRAAELIVANKELAAATERELAVIRNALDVICTIDADGKFVSMNPASGKMWGYEPDELIHGSYLALVVPDDVQKTIASAQSNMSGKALTDFENRYTHKDGSIISLMWTSHWSTSEQLMFSVAHDITERKRAEDELRNIAAQLKRSNEELQDFASVASHDLQEPLRKVQAFGERLRDKCGDALSEDGLLYLDRMQNAASRMQILINDLMTFARVTIMAQPFEPVDLKLVAEGVLSDLEMRIESTQGRVELGGLGTIDADSTQMRQLLQNLIGNALKFGRPGVPPVVKVRGRIERNRPNPDGLGGNYDNYKLTVEDNGIGFEAKYVDRIFKVFQRLHGRTEYEGTGIGLAVCRKITERHGGTISVESVPDKGTIFTVDLPVHHEEEIINEYF